MREINKISEALFEKIRDRFEDVSLGDDKAKATQDPEKARFFNFDYDVEGKNYGNITISIIDEISLKVYFSKNISHSLEKEERDHWYAFLRELREFAKRNMLSFEPRDITRSTLKHRDLQQQSKADSTFDSDEVVSESKLHGTSRSSYQECGPVKIIVRHSGRVDPERRGDRSRHIKAIYLETADGERFRLPENNLRLARAQARHVSEGGNINDEFGQHITEIADEIKKLRPFKNAMRRRTFEDAETQQMVEAAFEYHGLLNNTLKRMSGRKGYHACKESFVAEQPLMDDFDVDALRERFVKRTYNERMEDALPLVQKAYKMKKENTNPYLQQFESWATEVTEEWDDAEDDAQQWGEEPINIDDLVDALNEELPLGVDAVNAIAAIRGVINSDELEDTLVTASQQDPAADARDVIVAWVQENEPNVYQELMNEIGDVEPADQDLGESGIGDAPIDSMTRADLLDYLGASPEEVMNVSDEELRAAANEKAESLPEGDTYGASGMDEPVVDEGYDEDTDSTEAIQAAIIRRITRQHLDLLAKHGPQAIMDAAADVAWDAGPVEEIGSSDVSAWVKEVEYQLEGSKGYNEALEKHLSEEYCDACDSTECHCNEVDESVAGDDHVNRDVKMKRMGAKPLGMLDKLKGIKHGFDAARKGESEDELKLYNKQFKEDIEQMRRIAGLK